MRWYRSLYWRIAIGFIAVPRRDARRPGDAVRLGRVAHRVRRCLASRRTLRADHRRRARRGARSATRRSISPSYVRRRVRARRAPVLRRARRRPRDRRRTFPAPYPEPLLARGARAARSAAVARRCAIGSDVDPAGAAAGLRTPGRDRPGRRLPAAAPAPIVVGGELAGVVVVPPRAPFRFLLARYAPTLGARRRGGARRRRAPRGGA